VVVEIAEFSLGSIIIYGRHQLRARLERIR
jgi:hypothetical protein